MIQWFDVLRGHRREAFVYDGGAIKEMIEALDRCMFAVAYKAICIVIGIVAKYAGGKLIVFAAGNADKGATVYFCHGCCWGVGRGRGFNF